MQLYTEKYGGERLCLVGKGIPDVRDAEGRHGWRIGGVQVHSGGKRVVVVVGCFSFLDGVLLDQWKGGRGGWLMSAGGAG